MNVIFTFISGVGKRLTRAKLPGAYYWAVHTIPSRNINLSEQKASRKLEEPAVTSSMPVGEYELGRVA